MPAHPANNLKIFKTANNLYQAAAHFIITIAKKAIAERGKFTIALSGGETPQKLYSLLSQPVFQKQLQWSDIFIFWGDERCVPLNDERSNAHMAKALLLDRIDIPPGNIHFIKLDLPPAEAASNYEKQLKEFFGKKPPEFDLVLLGLGKNGHIASIFPGTDAVTEQHKYIREVFVKNENIFRITMTIPVINHAHHILFLVTGKKKATILKKVMYSRQPDKLPAQLIKPVKGELFWFVDQEAAALIT